MGYLDWLICYLSDEYGEIIDIPEDYDEKERLWRALVNVRQPNEIDDMYIQHENEFLQDRLKQFHIVKMNEIKSFREELGIVASHCDTMCLYKGDITKMEIDAIVNPANEGGIGCFIANHDCLDNQITTYGGVCVRLEDKRKVKELGGSLATGMAMITKGYNLPCKYIVHTTGPYVEHEVSDNDKKLLEECYRSCLDLARENNIRTIAFPTISTGVFNFPKDIASFIAIRTVSMYLDKYKNSFDKVVFCVYSDEDLETYKEQLGV